MAADLANETGLCKEWDPVEIRNPDQPTRPEPKRLDPLIPHAQGREMAVFVPPLEAGKVDVFIDDLIDTFPDSVRTLAMHVTSRPHAGNSEPPLRRAMLSMLKLVAEGSPSEQQIALGWLLDTRRLLVSLPSDKHEAWLGTINRIINDKGGLKEELNALEGQLNHAAHAIPLARHFLTRLRAARSSRTNKKSWAKLDKPTLADLILWTALLAKAHTGISMNLTVTRRPSRICWSDSCPFGLGGFLLRSDRAWRARIPKDSVLHVSAAINNLLEFLGTAVNVLLECSDSDAQDCILAVGDNTSGTGWIHKSSRLKSAAHKAHLMVLVLNVDCCLASQHLQGDLNTVADLLSFLGGITRAGGKTHPIVFDDPPDDILTQRFHLHCPGQIPENFKTSPLPSAISSWVLSILQTAASSLTAELKKATNQKTEPGDAGSASAPKPEEAMTLSSISHPQTDKSFSSDPSSPAFERPDGKREAESLKASVKSQWSGALCAKPQATWLRRLGTITNKVPSTATCSLFKAFSNAHPAPQCQRAITPKLLRGMHASAGLDLPTTHDLPAAVAADLAVVGSLCAHARTPQLPNQAGVTFLDRDKRETPHEHPGLSLAVCVKFLFADQKNREKNDWRSQKRTDDPVLCPVRRAASLIERIWRMVPGFTVATTVKTCAQHSRKGPVTLQLASGFPRTQLRPTCATLGVFCFDHMDIGAKSVWSGAAMGLFLANHSTERIMLMGRWLSQAFLVCIRSQVIEWTNNMSSNMIRLDSFANASRFNVADPEIPCVPHPGSMVLITPSSQHFIWLTEGARVKSKHTTSGTRNFNGSEPNLGVALD
jgi:hypothetical protein